MDKRKRAAPEGNDSHKRQSKDKAFTLHFIRTKVEKGTGKTLFQLIQEHSNLQRYNMALFYVTTSNKAICEAMCIPVEAGTRYKDRLEKYGHLVVSVDKFVCPFTKERGVQFLSTNPKEFDRLRKSSDTQLKMFENE